MTNRVKNKGGRPNKIKTVDWKLIEKLYINGLTDKQVAGIIGVTDRTINNWKTKYPKFFQSLKGWKKEADFKVEKSLYQRALGYDYSEIKEEDIVVEGQTINAKKRTTTYKQVAPDVTAQIFWLKNRKPDEWRDKKDVEHTGEVVLATRIQEARQRAFSHN